MNLRWPGKAPSLLLGCLGLIAILRCEAQNLVPNPSFELLDTCPYTIGFQPGDRPLYWHSWLNSPDYFHACAGSLQDIDTLVSVPQNGFGYQYAWEGDAYIGGWCYWVNDDYREYIGVPLLEPLEIGQTYLVSFRVNLAVNGSYVWSMGACNNVGVLFTMASNAWSGTTGPPFPFRNYAHVYSPGIIADSLGWTLVSGSFTADSAYQYLVLGNFFTNALTDTIGLPPWNGEVAYYFIDEVCVSREEGGCVTTGFDEALGQVGAFAAYDAHAQQVVLTWPGSRAYHVEVVDPAGRRVVSVRAEEERLRLDAQQWATGLYVARMREGDRVGVVKFVVNR
ncbi:MAG: T9SS type A sorting domain-containing protein [Flavobacteriales bacterium]|nr:T9SS type A sorting domain-containing protein [Flavobacteriales bacterium]